MFHPNHCEHDPDDYIGSIEHEHNGKILKLDVHKYLEFKTYAGYCARYSPDPPGYWSINTIVNCENGEKDIIRLLGELANKDCPFSLAILKLLYLKN